MTIPANDVYFFNDDSCKQTENACRTGPGAAVAIAGAIFLLMSFIASALMFPPNGVMFDFKLAGRVNKNSDKQSNNETTPPTNARLGTEDEN